MKNPTTTTPRFEVRIYTKTGIYSDIVQAPSETLAFAKVYGQFNHLLRGKRIVRSAVDQTAHIQ